MLNTKRSLIIILSLLILQVIIYSLFIAPYITSWGASDEEVHMPLIGDDLTPSYTSTRAIVLNAPISQAWQSIISLGADRGGFYSYTFMEDLAGYAGKKTDKSKPEIYDMKAGRVVPGCLEGSSEFVKGLTKKYHWEWKVLEVDPGRAYVLKGWGAFVLKEITPEKTRLIVRTHEANLPGFRNGVSRFMVIPLHYIMERRMMIGFKAEFEPHARPSYVADILWFSGILLSFFGMIALVFMGRGMRSVLVPGILGIFWQCVLFVFDPLPLYSLILTVVIVIMVGWVFYGKRDFTS